MFHFSQFLLIIKNFKWIYLSLTFLDIEQFYSPRHDMHWKSMLRWISSLRNFSTSKKTLVFVTLSFHTLSLFLLLLSLGYLTVILTWQILQISAALHDKKNVVLIFPCSDGVDVAAIWLFLSISLHFTFVSLPSWLITR